MNELKHNDDNIFSFEETSSPFKSEVGFLSAYPSFWALCKSSLNEMLFSAKPNSYLAIMAYIDNNCETNQILKSLRKRIVSKFGIATTLGYGPRFLHSTGQLHKGGINSGLFLQITEINKLDFTIPGEDYSFSKLVSSQAFGDRLALALNARKVMHIDIGSNLLSLEDLN